MSSLHILLYYFLINSCVYLHKRSVLFKYFKFMINFLFCDIIVLYIYLQYKKVIILDT